MPLIPKSFALRREHVVLPIPKSLALVTGHAGKPRIRFALDSVRNVGANNSRRKPVREAWTIRNTAAGPG
jgi:hypothetical protein